MGFLELLIVAVTVGLAVAYLLRLALRRSRKPGCGGSTGCGDRCRLATNKKV